MNDAITKGRRDDFASDRIMDDKSDPAGRLVVAAQNTVAQEDDVFDGIEFKTVFVDGFAFALAGIFVGAPKFL